MLSTIELTDDWNQWTASKPVEACARNGFEGANLPSKSQGRLHDERVHQLRDPAIYQENGKTYLLYSGAR
ncbi:MAG: hypothetical protein Ct9H90mP25_3430 [Gammaproteobacteria bacterium]|nr:MAG: hypothetical protein Ct9H90mP25_3430 [Gammaproteobacteria bacterium]